MKMEITGNAKINIGLEILNKRDDGYHNINTFFYKIPIFDEIILENSPNFQFIFNSPDDIPMKDNLAYKATAEISRITRKAELPVRIIINKKIPTGGGLGGGSSNAGHLLKGLNEFLRLGISGLEMHEAGCKLGSDVPFFLLSANGAFARGRGEILRESRLRLPYFILLVFPGIFVSTAQAYGLLDPGLKQSEGTDYIEATDILLHKPEEIRKVFRNDLEEPVFKLQPELANVKQQLYEAGAIYASMSGSGSTMFGFFFDENSAIKAAGRFNQYKTEICRPD